MAEELAGGFVDDSDVEVIDDQDDRCVFVSAADADVVHSAGSSEGDCPGFVDSVVSDPVVVSGALVVWLVFG